MSPVTDVIIDCDPGIDDASALMLAIRSGALNVRAITCVTGNLLADRCAQNACRVLDILRAGEIPVSVGALQPLVRQYAVDPFSHGSDGLADIGISSSSRQLDPRFAPDTIIEVAEQYPGISVLATAPLTNIALALMKAPRLVDLISHIYFIGGNYGFNECSQLYGTGTTPQSEWNVLVDPEATRLVFRSGIPLTAIGVDVWTREEMNLSDAELERLASSDRVEARTLAGFVGFVQGRGYGRYCAYIDATAIALLLNPTMFSTREVGVDVETVSPLTLGMTVVERRVHHAWTHLPRISVAYDADFSSFREFVVETLSA
jgi:purine nucleosidase/pyrimidine-specific ribonucleoside hydrolase